MLRQADGNGTTTGKLDALSRRRKVESLKIFPIRFSFFRGGALELGVS